MIKREFFKVYDFIESLNENELKINLKSAILSKLNETFNVINDSIKKQEDYIFNNLILNDHEKKHQIFGLYLNHCGKCLKGYSLQYEDSYLDLKTCDLCFSNETFQTFFLQCNGCQSKICTFCSSNLICNKNFPCISCYNELRRFKVAKSFCSFCENPANISLNCEKCNFIICENCEKIILIIIFGKSSGNKFEAGENKIIEDKILMLLQENPEYKTCKGKLDEYLNRISHILKDNYGKYEVLSLKSYLNKKISNFAKCHSIDNNNNHEKKHNYAKSIVEQHNPYENNNTININDKNQRIQQNYANFFEKNPENDLVDIPEKSNKHYKTIENLKNIHSEVYIPEDYEKYQKIQNMHNEDDEENIVDRSTSIIAKQLEGTIPINPTFNQFQYDYASQNYNFINSSNYDYQHNFDKTKDISNKKEINPPLDKTVVSLLNNSNFQVNNKNNLSEHTISSVIGISNNSKFEGGRQYNNPEQTICTVNFGSSNNSKLEENYKNYHPEQTITTVSFSSIPQKTMINPLYDSSNNSRMINSRNEEKNESPSKTIKSSVFSFVNNQSAFQNQDQSFQSPDKTVTSFVFNSQFVGRSQNLNKPDEHLDNQQHINQSPDKTMASFSFNSQLFAEKSQNLNKTDEHHDNQQQTILSSFGNKIDDSHFSNQNQTILSCSINSNFPLNNKKNDSIAPFSRNDDFDDSSPSLNLSPLSKNTPKLSLIEILSDFENIFEKFCKEHDFDDINKNAIRLLSNIQRQDCEMVYSPDMADNLYTYKDSIATMKDLLGEGGYGSVYDFFIKDEKNNEKNSVVGKVFRINQNNKNDFYFGLISFLKEWKVLRMFNQDNIIKIYGVFYRTDFKDNLKSVGIFLEKMDESLDKYIKNKKKHKNFEKNLHIAWQISIGLKYIHDSHRIHRDIKPGNIMIDNKSNKAKLIDFGTISGDIVQKQVIMDDAFTISYAPPEFIRYYYFDEKVYLDFGSDIWSLGVTLYELFAENTIDFPWLKFLSQFESKDIVFEKLRVYLENDAFLQENQSEQLEKFVKQKLEKNIELRSLQELLQKCFIMKSSQRIEIDQFIKELAKMIHEYEDRKSHMDKPKKSKASDKNKEYKHMEKSIFDEPEKRSKISSQLSKGKISTYEKVEECKEKVEKNEILNNAVKRKNKF